MVFTLEQRWKKSVFASLSEPAIDLQKMPILAKKKHLFKWSSFWSWRVFKQAKLSHLGHRKPARIYGKAMTHSKRVTVWCRIWSKGIIEPSFLENEQGEAVTVMAIVVGRCWTNFCSQKLKRRILATFGFNRMVLRFIQPKLHSMFCALFLKIALSATELVSFGHLGAAICLRWTIICRVPSKICVTPTSQRQLAF